ncbi:MAG: V-type proton ATPase subunit E [Sphaerochaeta sp.]|jgi:V/A-type H+-transporting ATPase subunit E|nr:V-type proton ATPase subunit E [Sphaerochaeta sp.]MCI2104078.1 V-type proton ATPase subunit E [Sphaerochaeta sp.]MCI2127831.1 V-type proton ATPase subunit E [Sphaerochaeta sp.]
MEKADNLLLDGIVQEAQKKADAIRSQTAKQIADIQAEAEKKREQMLADEDAQAALKLKQVQLRLEANMASAKRRSALKRIDDNYQVVMERVEKKFSDFARSEAFKPYLAQWIAEAAVGLDLKEAKVAFSPLCPVDQKLLDQAMALVKQFTGSDVHLVLDSRPIRGIGVVLSSMDDKVSYNNQVDIRLRRFDRDIRTLVQEHTWKAE